MIVNQRTVWVYRIPVDAITATFTNHLSVPEGATLLHCREQGLAIALWYEIPDPDAPKTRHGFQIFGTGTGPIGDHLQYVATTIFADGALVLHVYEVSGDQRNGRHATTCAKLVRNAACTCGAEQ